ncbi:hypothetical protein ACVDG5_005940 [Mesorhizobium sp. ORM6]
MIATMPHLTVLSLFSGRRAGSYVEDIAVEQEDLVDAMRMPDVLRVKILAAAETPRPLKSSTYLKRRLLAACGIHPRARSFVANTGAAASSPGYVRYAACRRCPRENRGWTTCWPAITSSPSAMEPSRTVAEAPCLIRTKQKPAESLPRVLI